MNKVLKKKKGFDEKRNKKGGKKDKNLTKQKISANNLDIFSSHWIWQSSYFFRKMIVHFSNVEKLFGDFRWSCQWIKKVRACLHVYKTPHIYTHIHAYIGRTTHTHTHTHTYIYIYIYIHMFSLIYSHTREDTHTHTYTHSHVYIYIYIYKAI